MTRRALDGAQLRILVVHPHPDAAERIAVPLRKEAFRVITLSRVEATVPLFQAFQPQIALIGASHGDVGAAFEVARRLRTASGGALPILYVCEGRAPLLKLCLEEGDGVGAVAFPAERDLLAARVRAAARYGQALQRSLRAQLGGARDPALRDATTDGAMPGLFIELVRQALRRGERSGESFSILTVKLLRFPRFQKEFGPAIAERLVSWASVAVSQTFREADSLARLGEAELGMLLAGADADHGQALLSRLAERVSRSRFEVDGRVVRPEVSLGLASFPDLIAGPEDYLRAARENAHVRQIALQAGSAELQNLSKVG